MIGKPYPKGPSERANHRLLMACGLLGGVIGLSMAFVTHPENGPKHDVASVLTSPLPAWFALAIAFLWGVVLPIISWRWHRVVDEHERQAYRDGAVAGFYVMGIGAPVWWFLARGGMAPAVDAVWLYVAMLATSGIVWIWRKYA